MEATPLELEGLDPAIVRGLLDLGYRELLPVQKACLKPLLDGRSISVRSRTGTGKTAAFGIPLLQSMDPARAGVDLMVLAPTRELAAQVARDLAAIGRHRHLRVAGAWGGASLPEQTRALREGAQIVVGTPGRMLDLVERKVLHLGQTTRAVLDEADEMLSMGFIEDVTRLLSACRSLRQLVILSASLDPATESLIASFASDIVRVDLSTDGLSVEEIDNVCYEIGDDLPRTHYLLYALAAHRPSSAIVFVNTRTDASLVATVMAREGYSAEMLSGALAQRERERVMQGIREGRLRFLVATDIAARGIDISHLSHVFNYNLPEDPAVYLHRVGRTGRVGRKGTAVSLLTARDLRTRSEIERRFRVAFRRLAFPPPAEMVKERIMAHIESLLSSAEAAICDGFAEEARVILGHPRAEQIVAFLLKRNAERVHDEQRSPDNRPSPEPRRGPPRRRRRR